LKYPEEEEEVGEEVIMVEGEIIEEDVGIQEEAGEDLAAGAEEEGIIAVAAAVEEETEENTEAEEEEESLEAVEEEDRLVEVDTGKGRDLLMVEVTDMRAGVHHHHQPPPLVEKEIITEKKGEDLHHVMGLPEDHRLLPGTVMVRHVEIMEAPLLQGLQEDPMRVEDLAVEADMMTATQAGVPLLHPGTGTGAEVPWPAGIPHHMLGKHHRFSLLILNPFNPSLILFYLSEKLGLGIRKILIKVSGFSRNSFLIQFRKPILLELLLS